MARLRPALENFDQLLEPLNEGEMSVARSLAQLDDEWTVYVQPRLGLDVPDFVAVHDRHGVCTIEVKNWRHAEDRQTEDGLIESRGTDGTWQPSGDQPKFRANRHRSTIYDHFFALPQDGTDVDDTVRAIVAVPQFSDAHAVQLLRHTSTSPSANTIAVFGAESILDNLEAAVRGQGCEPPRDESIIRLKQFLVASERVAERPAPLARSPQSRDIELNQSGTGVRRMRGPAGSGKSFGLAARAARLAASGKSVLVLSFNITLANHLRTMVTERCNEYGANPTLVSCANFHSFCTHVVQDAELLGIQTEAPRGASWPVGIFAKARQAFEGGFELRYDAVLVDEGQDYTMPWWLMMRERVVATDGEMLLVADPTQDLYGKKEWTDTAPMFESGFSSPWTDLTGSYRLPPDLVPLANGFASTHLGDTVRTATVLDDHPQVVGDVAGSIRQWLNVDAVSDVGVAVGREVVRLLHENPSLAARDVAFLCEYHHDGVAAAAVIEAAGHHVHHIFSRDPDDARRRRKYRFWPDADGVKGCTAHSFKGWETQALVMGIGMESRSKRLAYVAMTRVKGHVGANSFISVVNADKRIADFKQEFDGGTIVAAPAPIVTELAPVVAAPAPIVATPAPIVATPAPPTPQPAPTGWAAPPTAARVG